MTETAHQSGPAATVFMRSRIASQQMAALLPAFFYSRPRSEPDEQVLRQAARIAVQGADLLLGELARTPRFLAAEPHREKHIDTPGVTELTRAAFAASEGEDLAAGLLDDVDAAITAEANATLPISAPGWPHTANGAGPIPARPKPAPSPSPATEPSPVPGPGPGSTTRRKEVEGPG